MSHSRPKIERIINSHERILQRLFQKQDLEPNKHKYYLMEIKTDKIQKIIYSFKTREKKSKLMNLISVRPYNYKDEKDQRMFMEIFNLVLLSSPDPWRPLSLEDVSTHFKDGVFLAFLYGKCVGHGVLTIENTEHGKIGVIAGIGVHPKHRRKNIAFKLALEMAQWFIAKDDLIKLQCEVYENNEVSYKFISSFGFEKVDEFFLE